MQDRTRLTLWRCLSGAWIPPLLVASALAWAAPGDDTAQLTPEQTLALALEASSEGRPDEMMAWLRESAEAGHRPAQDLLGVMLLNREIAPGARLDANACEALAWFVRGAGQGSEIGRLYRDLLNRRPVAARCL